MVRWANELYCDDYMMRRKQKIIRAVRAGKLKPGAYCIALSSNPENLFDIIRASEFLFPHYNNVETYVLGLAHGYDSAVAIVIDMIQEVYAATGEFDVRKYYRERWDLC